MAIYLEARREVWKGICSNEVSVNLSFSLLYMKAVLNNFSKSCCDNLNYIRKECYCIHGHDYLTNDLSALTSSLIELSPILGIETKH